MRQAGGDAPCPVTPRGFSVGGWLHGYGGARHPPEEVRAVYPAAFLATSHAYCRLPQADLALMLPREADPRHALAPRASLLSWSPAWSGIADSVDRRAERGECLDHRCGRVVRVNDHLNVRTADAQVSGEVGIRDGIIYRFQVEKRFHQWINPLFA
jgi:hypothetical protein